MEYKAGFIALSQATKQIPSVARKLTTGDDEVDLELLRIEEEEAVRSRVQNCTLLRCL